MGLNMIRKTVLEGTCRDCGSPVERTMAYIGEDGIRGITLEYTPVKRTGYVIRCTNEECPNHTGEGTLD